MASALERWWLVVDEIDDGDPADLLAPDVVWSITFAGTTKAGGREELLEYNRTRIAAGRRHQILLSTVSGAVEVVAGELLENGAPILTFAATAESDAQGRLTQYLAVASADIHMALPPLPES